MREWTLIEEGEVDVDRRHLVQSSQQAIRWVDEALVELITNSDDAYRKLEDPKGKIIIEVSRRRKNSSTILAKDRAGGMTLSELKEKILRYGAYHAYEKSRAFMGRGAKDIASLGLATFDSIKDGLISRVQIFSDFRKKIMKPELASNSDYDEFGVRQGKGGTRVTLELKKGVRLPKHEGLRRDLERYPPLRNLIQQREVVLVDTVGKKKDTLRYNKPEGELVLEEPWLLPEPYKGAIANLQIWKAPMELPSELQEGIIISDDYAVHEVTRFAPDLDQDPIGRRLFGELHCSYIRDLQLDFEERRKNGEEPLEHNPVDIVDPTRRKGLDQDHPLVKKLYVWGEGYLRLVVDELKAIEREKAKPVVSDETKRRLKEFSKAVADHFKKRLEEETLGVSTSEQEATLNREGVLLNPQFQRIAVGEIRRMGYTVLSLADEEDPEKVKVETDSEFLRVFPQNPRLSRQKKNPDRLTAYFEIEGVEPSEEVTLKVIHKLYPIIPPISRTLRIEEAEDPFAQYQYGLFFENQNYTVRNNGTRTLSFIAKGRKFRGVDWTSRDLVESSNPEAVVVLDGRNLKVEEPSKDVWKGKLRVEGRGIGSSSTITLSIATKTGPEITSASVNVVEKEESHVSIQIDLVNEDGGAWRAQWDRENQNRLKVFLKHPTLSRYLGTESQNYPGQEQPHFRILLAEVVAEKVVERILEKRREIEPRLYEEIPYNFLQNDEMAKFLPIAHKVMISDIDAARLVKEIASLNGE